MYWLLSFTQMAQAHNSGGQTQISIFITSNFTYPYRCVRDVFKEIEDKSIVTGGGQVDNEISIEMMQ